MIFCEFCKIFKNIFSFDRTPPDDCFLCLSVNFEKFFRTLLSQSTSGKLLFHVQVAEFQLPNTVKNYFTGAFQAFCTRSGSSHSKALIYWKSLKTVKKLICKEVARCEPATLGKKTHTSSSCFFTFAFSECIKITCFEEALKVYEHKLF